MTHAKSRHVLCPVGFIDQTLDRPTWGFSVFRLNVGGCGSFQSLLSIIGNSIWTVWVSSIRLTGHLFVELRSRQFVYYLSWGLQQELPTLLSFRLCLVNTVPPLLLFCGVYLKKVIYFRIDSN